MIGFLLHVAVVLTLAVLIGGAFGAIITPLMAKMNPEAGRWAAALFRVFGFLFIHGEDKSAEAVQSLNKAIEGDGERDLREKDPRGGKLFAYIGPLLYLFLLLVLVVAEYSIFSVRILTSVFDEDPVPPAALEVLAGIGWLVAMAIWAGTFFDSVGLGHTSASPWTPAPGRTRFWGAVLAAAGLVLTIVSGGVLFASGELAQQGKGTAGLELAFAIGYGVAMLGAAGAATWAMIPGLAAAWLILQRIVRLGFKALHWLCGTIIGILEAAKDVVFLPYLALASVGASLWNWVAESSLGRRLRLGRISKPQAAPSIRPEQIGREDAEVIIMKPKPNYAVLNMGKAALPLYHTIIQTLNNQGGIVHVAAAGAIVDEVSGYHQTLRLPVDVSPATEDVARAMESNPKPEAMRSILMGVVQRTAAALKPTAGARPVAWITWEPRPMEAEEAVSIERFFQGMREAHVDIAVIAKLPPCPLRDDRFRLGLQMLQRAAEERSVHAVFFVDPHGFYAASKGPDALYESVAATINALILAPHRDSLSPSPRALLEDLRGASPFLSLRIATRGVVPSDGAPPANLEPTTSRIIPLQPLVQSGDGAMAEALSAAEASALGVDVPVEHWSLAEAVPLRSDDPGCRAYQMRRRASAVAAGAWHAVFAPGVPFGLDMAGVTRAVSVFVVFTLTVAPTDLFGGSRTAAGEELTPPSRPKPVTTPAS